ncbi:hypothetical protein Pla52n_45580 [Stieleria varia]|uniref:Uncharacterized protein n=1 Tax=Stieleria varia TaxID=2528005 RepID=A0A5C6AQ30_9BACT|nr:hypothetical protein Pla52n_45580 [Stieleria varia]
MRTSHIAITLRVITNMVGVYRRMHRAALTTLPTRHRANVVQAFFFQKDVASYGSARTNTRKFYTLDAERLLDVDRRPLSDQYIHNDW